MSTIYMQCLIRSGIDVVGHIPRNISTPCNLFFTKGCDAISCVASGHQYSSDLPQGGLPNAFQRYYEND